MSVIYALCCPDTGAVRYIGKANDPQKRLASHLRDSQRRSTPVYCWIRKLAQSGKRPEMRALLETADWRVDEVRIIAEYRAQGASLLNVADGGDEPACPIEVRAANGRKNARAVHDDPFRRRIWENKKAIGETLRYFVKRGDVERANRVRSRMRELAVKCPQFFSDWAGA